MFFPLIIPVVAVGSKDISNKPKGLPNAIAIEPTFTLSESPLKGGVKLYPSILRIARSVKASKEILSEPIVNCSPPNNLMTTSLSSDIALFIT